MGKKRLPAGPTRERHLLRCQNKKRHPDEVTARACGMHTIKQVGNTDKLYVYQCPVCSGWHLTRKQNGQAVTADDPVSMPDPKLEVLAIMQDGPVTTYIATHVGRSRNDAWLHEMCLALERDQKIYRFREDGSQIVWRVSTRPVAHPATVAAVAMRA